MPMQSRDLFGGAIKVQLPSELIDVSDFRQVPDNQEVLVQSDSDLSVIVEVLQLAREEGAAENADKAIRFHFSSLAHDNSASSSSIDSIQLPSHESPQSDLMTPEPTLLIGKQVVKKFGKDTEPDDTVQIFVALWRLPVKDVDLVMSVNQPFVPQEGGAASSTVSRMFVEAAKSLVIHDWTLFA